MGSIYKPIEHLVKRRDYSDMKCGRRAQTPTETIKR